MRRGWRRVLARWSRCRLCTDFGLRDRMRDRMRGRWLSQAWWVERGYAVLHSFSPVFQSSGGRYKVICSCSAFRVNMDSPSYSGKAWFRVCRFLRGPKRWRIPAHIVYPLIAGELTHPILYISYSSQERSACKPETLLATILLFYKQPSRE